MSGDKGWVSRVRRGGLSFKDDEKVYVSMIRIVYHVLPGFGKALLSLVAPRYCRLRRTQQGMVLEINNRQV